MTGVLCYCDRSILTCMVTVCMFSALFRSHLCSYLQQQPASSRLATQRKRLLPTPPTLGATSNHSHSRTADTTLSCKTNSSSSSSNP